MRTWLKISLIVVLGVGSVFGVSKLLKAVEEPGLTSDQIIEIRTKQVAWLRMEASCSSTKAEVDKVAAKYTPAGYVIQDGPDGLKLVKAPKQEKSK